MRNKFALLAAILALAVALPASAQWYPGDPYKWLQMPDLSANGMDVSATGSCVLADDFGCTERGPLTDITIWGSWYYDEPPYGDPGSVGFILSIHADIPADQSPTGYSMPGELLWYREFWPYPPCEFTCEVWQDSLDEGWLDPPDYYEPSADEICYQYSFHIDASDAFWQEGSMTDTVIYWLNVQAYDMGGALFGWKTSTDHWNDDAVWVSGTVPHDGDDWMELRYPPGHPLYPQSIDLAFVVDSSDFKWVQYPDLDPTGIDVNAMEPYILADDFQCTREGLIYEIYVWGSWYHDELPLGDPGWVSFILSIHEDIRADQSPTGHSMPGEALWYRQFSAYEFTYEIWEEGLDEGWMDPPTLYEPHADTTCYRYNFYINPSEAFRQEGSVDDTVIYWLNVQAIPEFPGYDEVFGWKTSLHHWNDNAVWVEGTEPFFGDWNELRYPPGHPFYPGYYLFDLAFGIVTGFEADVPEEETVPDAFGLRQNIPNPFNATTMIGYDVPAGGGHVTVEVYDVAGRRVCTLVDGHRTAGRKTVTWHGVDESGRELPSGVYFYRLSAGSYETTRKMMLLK